MEFERSEKAISLRAAQNLDLGCEQFVQQKVAQRLLYWSTQAPRLA
jgi:hypothetical protein